MAQELSHPARSEMPEIPSPNAFGVETLHELAKNCFNPVAHVSKETWPRLLLAPGRFVRSQEIETIVLQALRQLRLPIIAVRQDKTRHALQHFFCAFRIVNIGGCQGTIHQDTGPSQAYMGTQSIVGLA